MGVQSELPNLQWVFGPERIKAYVCLSVPFKPKNPKVRPVGAMRALYEDAYYIFISQRELEVSPNCPAAVIKGNWVKAQEWAAVPGSQATYLGNPVPRGTLPTIMVIEFLAISFVEHQRSMEKDPEKKKYPGGAFDPLGYSKVPKAFQNLKGSEEKGKYSFG